MALNNYLQLTRLLLSDISIVKLNDFDLTAYINQARLQVASQGRCIRAYATIPLVAGQQIYPFSAITTLPTGVSGVFHVRQAWIQIPGTTGQIKLYSRPFEDIGQFGLNKFNPSVAQPVRWAQYGQGQSGSVFFDPTPDLPYTVFVDALGVPAPLTSDTTPEGIPANWTLAVPFYAAWWGFLTAQMQDQADKIMQRFMEQMAMARTAANPDLTMENWSQSPDAEEPNRIGAQRVQ